MNKKEDIYKPIIINYSITKHLEGKDGRCSLSCMKCKNIKLLKSKLRNRDHDELIEIIYDLKSQIHSFRLEKLNELTRLSQELGLYDDYLPKK